MTAARTRLAAALRRCWGDTAGGVAVVMAFFSVVLVGSAAVGVDGAHFFLVKRHQQAATDMAAMAAATSLATASATATSVMAANGFPQAVLQVTPGAYTADPTLAAPARFAASGAPNAVQVVSVTTEPFIFGTAFRLLMGTVPSGNGFPIQTTATARKQDEAAFTLGSGLAALDGGIANALLGSLLGTTLTLSALDYQSLGNASVDLFGFSDALATQLHLSGATYGSLALTAVSRSTVLSSLAATMQGSAGAGAALRALAAATPVGAGASPLGALIDFGPAGNLTIGSPHPLSAKVSALSLIQALAVLGGSGHAVSLDLGTGIPGLGATQMLLALGEPAVGSSFSAVGAEGATLHTAQVRLLLTTQIGGAGLPAGLSLPLYLEIAPATATIATIACTAGAAQAGVTLGVTTGIANAAIGSVSPSDFTALSTPPPISSATLLNLAGVLRIKAKGQVTASSSSPVPVPFSAMDIQAGTAKTVSSGVSVAALMSSLVAGTQVTVTTLGATLPAPGVPAAVTAALQAALPPIDALVAQTLATLGVSLGTATTTVPGVRCGQGSLVN